VGSKRGVQEGSEVFFPEATQGEERRMAVTGRQAL
jgi:hypothetical protein